MSEPTRDEVELLSPENLKVVEDCIDMGKDDGDIATIHIDRLQAVLDGYKAALAANREKDAKIVQLRGLLASQDGAMEENCRLRSELASLRASGGEKWIEIEEGCDMPENNDLVLVVEHGMVHAAYFEKHHASWLGPIPDSFVRLYGEDGRYDATHWMPRPAPPTLTKEKE